jgi:hypothetical protein
MGPLRCPEMSVTTNLRCVTSQKSEDVICNRGGSLKLPTTLINYQMTPVSACMWKMMQIFTKYSLKSGSILPKFFDEHILLRVQNISYHCTELSNQC